MTLVSEEKRLEQVHEPAHVRIPEKPAFGDILADATLSGPTIWGTALVLILAIVGGILWGLGASRELERAVLFGKGAIWAAAILGGLVFLRWIAYLVSWRTVLTMDRELLSYFSSALAYSVLAGVVVVDTINFWDLVTQLQQFRVETAGEASPVVSFVAWNLWFWLAMLFIVPAITMRLIAEEKRSGTIEVALTAPIRVVEYVLGKYFAAFLFYAFLQIPSVLYLLRLRFFAEYEFELWPVVATYLGVLSVGAMFVAIGLLCSAATRSQVVAAMATFAVLLGLFSTFVFYYYAQNSITFSKVADLLKHVAVLPHLYELGAGRVNPVYFFYHLSVAAFMVYLAVKVVELRRAS